MLRLQLDNELIRHLYVDEKDNCIEIAKKLGVNRYTIYKRINLMGVKRSINEELIRQHGKGIHNNKVRDDKFMLAYSSGLTPQEIAEKFNYRYVSSVIHRLRKMGIDIPKYKVPKGDKNRMWKGGIIKRFGYNMVRNTEHPRAGGNGYVFEHILVWEEYHQKQVPKDWVIHHINGIKDNNRPENLLAMPKGKHDGLILQMGKRIRQLEIENRQLRRALEDSQSIFYISEN